MSRTNIKKNLITLLACSMLLLAALGCESVTGPDSDLNNSLSTSGDASFADSELPNG